MHTIDSNPLIEVKSQIGILRKIVLFISAVFGCIVIYSFMQVFFKLYIFEAIKQEWATILIFPLMLLFVFGVYFCIRDIIVDNKRKIMLYDSYFIITTNKFLFTKTIKLNYGVKIAHNFGFPFCIYNIMFFDINKQNLKWSDMKIKCMVHLPLFNTNTFDANMDKFMKMFQTKTKKFLRHKNTNKLDSDSIK